MRLGLKETAIIRTECRTPPDHSSPETMRDHLVERELTGRIISAFYHVYNRLGFGNLEANHCRALEIVLRERGIRVDREWPARVYFEGKQVGFHRLDMLVERRVIVEVKSTDVLPPFARRQLRNYLCALRLQVGLILHFGPEPKFYRLFVPNGNPASGPGPGES